MRPARGSPTRVKTTVCLLAEQLNLLYLPSGGPPDVGKMLGGEEKEQDPDAAKKEEERQEALRQQEEERKAKYAKMEAERERMRQGIRDKVRWREEGRGRREGRLQQLVSK